MRRPSGYALLELLVALAIFALLAAAAFGGLDAVARARASVAETGAELKALQRAVALLDRDLRGVVARPVRGAGGERRPALAGGRGGLELSTASFAPVASSQPSLARVAWVLVGGRLLRERATALDAAPTALAPTAPDALLDGVTRFELRYRSRAGAWREDWPPRDGPEAGLERLPSAVEWRIESEAFGRIVRLVELPDGPPAAGTGGP